MAVDVEWFEITPSVIIPAHSLLDFPLVAIEGLQEVCACVCSDSVSPLGPQKARPRGCLSLGGIRRRMGGGEGGEGEGGLQCTRGGGWGGVFWGKGGGVWEGGSTQVPTGGAECICSHTRTNRYSHG